MPNPTKAASTQGLPDKLKDLVENATVRFTATDGQGVLVPGGFVLTAAHCIEWSDLEGTVLGDDHPQLVTTRGGTSFRLRPRTIEPVVDIAALDAKFSKDCDAFEQWCETTTPVPLRDVGFEPGEPLRVHVLSHHGTWITAKVTRYDNGPAVGSVWLEADEPIVGGTSGGPVVDDAGRLVGVVSTAGDDDDGGESSGDVPVASLALPRWIWEQIAVAQRNG